MYRQRPKYHNKKTVVDGITFDSRKEGNRYGELRLLERAGAIRNLRLQVPYELIPSQYEKNPAQKGKPKCLERPVKYIADFVYEDTESGETVVEDTKGMRTPEYVIKRKMMLYVYGIRIREI